MWGFIIDGVPKPEASNQTKNSLHSELIQVKLFEQKDIIHDTQQLPLPLR